MSAAVDMRARAGDRILIVGQTGSGKSTVASVIANAWPRVLVLDPKLDDDVAELPNATIAYGARAALAALPGRVIYRPLPSEIENLPAAFEPLARRVFTAGSCGLVLHETEIVAPSEGARRWLRSLIAWGRSRRVPVIFCTQRPSRIDRLVRSEPAHVYLFRLNDRDDLRTMAGLFGVESSALRPLSTEHAFYYRGPDGVVHAMGPLSVRPR